MTSYAFLFEAKSIQEYILRSGRLRHIVGASELIDALGRNLLDDAIHALGMDDGKVRFSRRAGGAVFAFFDSQEARDALRDLWTLTVRQFAPGLPFVSAIGEGESDFLAYEQARKALDAARNWQVTAALPAGSPVTRFAPRTGLPAARVDSKFGDLDEATARFGTEQFWKGGGLANRFVERSAPKDWPHDLNYRDDGGTVFPFLGDNRYLGLLHADGNGLGQLLKTLTNHAKSRPDQFVEVFRAFSEAVETATRAAAARASAAVLEPARERSTGADPENGEAAARLDVYPARPIVLGGDDLTILIRADLAIPFAAVFLRAFEEESRKELTGLRREFPDIPDLPEALTAGAGIAFVKSNHPFYMAHDLCEGLAKWAKDRAKEWVKDREKQGQLLASGKRVPPTLALHRVTTASHGHYGDVRRDELTFGSDEQRIVTSLGAYCIDEETPGRPGLPGLPALKDLLELAGLFAGEDVARGPARQVLTLIGQDLDEARRRYGRWREVMAKRAKETLAAIDHSLARLLGAMNRELADDLPVGVPKREEIEKAMTGQTPAGQEGTSGSQEDKDKERIDLTPLADVATLLAIGCRLEEPADFEQARIEQEAA